MPTYDYFCDCGYETEKFQSIKDTTKFKCPKCNKQLRKKIGKGAGIIFKGSGFYKNDYGRRN